MAIALIAEKSFHRFATQDRRQTNTPDQAADQQHPRLPNLMPTGQCPPRDSSRAVDSQRPNPLDDLTLSQRLVDGQQGISSLLAAAV